MSDNLQIQYEMRRHERVIGLSLKNTLTNVENLMYFLSIYRSKSEDVQNIERMVDTLQDCYTKVKKIETELLNMSTTFYAAILPTAHEHKIEANENGNENPPAA